MSVDYILDSSAWIEYFGGTMKGTELKTIIEIKSIGTSIIAIAEIADAFEREGREETKEIAFIQNHAVVIPLTIPIAVQAAKIKWESRPGHPKFSLADGIHLVTAKKEQAILVTCDTDFSDVENVILK